MDISLDAALYKIRDGVLYINETGMNDSYKPAFYTKVYGLKLHTEGDAVRMRGEEESLRMFYEGDDPDSIDNDMYETDPVIIVMAEKYIFFGPKIERKRINSGWHCLKKRIKINYILKDMPIVVRFKNGERKDY